MDSTLSSRMKVTVIGAGPAGLTAAYQLGKVGIPVVVLEKDNVVGGLSRTARYKGFLFDIGGHRFFTKVKAVDELWHEILSEKDFLRRPRLSRIYYDKKFFYYPLRFWNALLGLGVGNSILILISYMKAQLFPTRSETTFENWVSNRFGKRLYRIFFKTYTEKVWGIPCSEITADWAAQRIKGLSLIAALKNALLANRSNNGPGAIRTLIDAFDYPRLGPGMMWERVQERVSSQGGEVHLTAPVLHIYHDRGRIEAVETVLDGKKSRMACTHIISTMPLRELVERMEPPAPARVVAAARMLKYRDFITVAVIVDKEELFPDNWIYIHEPDVRVGRIQNFKNWSPDMLPDPSKSCLGLEYFCFEGDGLWNSTDQELIELAKRELTVLGLVEAADVTDGVVVRMPKAYPVYDSTYSEALDVLRGFLAMFSNLQVVGRNGMHKYNNQDHAMLTAMLAVRNLLGEQHDLWQVNEDDEYHEEMTEVEDTTKPDDLRLLASTQPRVPERVSATKGPPP